MADLSWWLRHIESTHVQEIDMSLSRLSQVAERLALPRLAAWVVSVAGTNGKGSSCRFIEGLALAQGLRVGRFSSPHFLEYNERVCLQGEPATDAELVAAFERVEAARHDTPLTYFEYSALAAFDLFSRSQLDVCVLEVGLGGRLDAVNLIDADCALLVSVALDHQDYLGHDLNQIAIEKMGIARQGKPLIIGETAALPALTSFPEALGVQLLKRGQHFGERQGQWFWHQDGQMQCFPIVDTALPQENLAGALQAMAMSPFGLSLDVGAGQWLSRLSLPGRMQWVQRGQTRLLLDVAHNPHAAKRLASQLLSQPAPWQVVFAALADKDCQGIVEPLLPLAKAWHLVDLPGPRGMSARSLANRLPLSHPHCYPSVDAALDHLTRSTDPVLILGSFLTVTAAMQWLSNNPAT